MGKIVSIALLCLLSSPVVGQQPQPSRGEEYLRNRFGEQEFTIASLLNVQQSLQAEIVKLTAELAAIKKKMEGP